MPFCSFLVRIAAAGAAPSPCTRLPAFFFKQLALLPTLTLFFWFILSLLISIETCAYVVLSWYALRGEALRPPPCTPPPAFMFEPVPLATYFILFLISIVYLGSFYFLMFDIYRYLCLCTSFLARVAGGGAALPPPICFDSLTASLTTYSCSF